jgi:DNA-binding response OmpR family regulator
MDEHAAPEDGLEVSHLQVAQRLAEAAEHSRRQEGRNCGGGKAILYVEDEAFVREVTCDVLRNAGYRVMPAKNAFEAMKMFALNDIDLLLSDVILPGENGHALAAKLRRESPDLSVLLVTGYGDQMSGRVEGKEELLAKPFSSEKLLERVGQLLNREGANTAANKNHVMRASAGA